MATRPRLPLAERRTVDGFCYRNDLSKSFYYEIKRKGKGPRERWVDGKVLITPEDELAWQRADDSEETAA